MGLSHKALQDKRSKMAAKRKAAAKNKQRPVATQGSAGEWGRTAMAPIHEVLVPDALFELGIGTLTFSRELPDARIAVVGFLVDVFCLGVKNAFFTITPLAKYNEQRTHLERIGKSSVQHPAYARKLVEAAVAYAHDLGFDPHPDYKVARLIFGDVDATACPAHFEFGHEGKPFYCCGPKDTPNIQRRILTQLERRCGAKGFDYLLNIPS